MKTIRRIWCRLFHFNRLKKAKHIGWNGAKDKNIFQCKTCGFYFEEVK